MSYRPLAFVSGLTLGDYLLWNWSLNANHDVIALVSGLTLPPLVLAFAWMLALTLVRLIGSSARRSGRGVAMAASDADRDREVSEAAAGARSATGRDGSTASSGSKPPSSGKLAA
ncbi:MAG TPA: hypothetical protein VNZ01_09730 [Solirubrobacteraceae bacterium]|nr:hypothetical protein [Solirubrobacteraceae bacterium]